MPILKVECESTTEKARGQPDGAAMMLKGAGLLCSCEGKLEFAGGAADSKAKGAQGLGLPRWLCQPCAPRGRKSAPEGNKAEASGQKTSAPTGGQKREVEAEAKKPAAEGAAKPKAPEPPQSAPTAQQEKAVKAQQEKAVKPQQGKSELVTASGEAKGTAKPRAPEQRGLAVKEGEGLLCCLFVRKPASGGGCLPFRLAVGRGSSRKGNGVKA